MFEYMGLNKVNKIMMAQNEVNQERQFSEIVTLV